MVTASHANNVKMNGERETRTEIKMTGKNDGHNDALRTCENNSKRFKTNEKERQRLRESKITS